MASPVIDMLRWLFTFVLRTLTVLFEWLFKLIKFITVRASK